MLIQLIPMVILYTNNNEKEMVKDFSINRIYIPQLFLPLNIFLNDGFHILQIKQKLELFLIFLFSLWIVGSNLLIQQGFLNGFG